MTQQIQTSEEYSAFNTVCNRLLEVLHQSQNQDAIFNSFSTAWILIYDTFELLQENFPVATVSNDGDQGIEITWNSEDNFSDDLINKLTKIQLSCSSISEKYTYLSCEFNGKTNVLRNVSALTLACWLQWFNLSQMHQDQYILTINK